MFERLIHQQAASANRLLGGIDVIYTGQGDSFQTKIIIDNNVLMPDDNGLGVRQVTLATIPLASVGNVTIGDQITTPTHSYVVSGIAADDGVTVEAFIRSL